MTNIKLNGKSVKTDCKTVAELKKDLFSDEDIVIINGFQTSNPHTLLDGDEIYIIKKGVMPPHDELEAMMSARHTPHVHKKLKSGRVAIAGLGGLGSNIAVNLTRIGVGHLFLIDFDVVEPSNLNRQSYYIKHLGMNKTDALKQQLSEINPFIDIKTKNIKVDPFNIEELFKDYDIVCEAFDNPQAKAMLVNTILTTMPNTKIVSGSGMAGYSSSNTIQTTKKLKNLYICGDYTSEAKEGQGLMAPRVQICAGHQSNMILRLLLGIETV